MSGKIFISYRRGDVAGYARSIYDGLVRRFSRSNVFMDVDNLIAGQRFDRELDKALSRCDVLIAVMGPDWMELLAQSRDQGERDYARDEIAAALKREIVVIPVRVGQAGHMMPLPRRDNLPEDIRDLVLHQKHDVAHEHFARDIADLVAAIRMVRRAQRPPLPLLKPITMAVGASLVMLAGVALVYQYGAIQRVTDAWRTPNHMGAVSKTSDEATKPSKAIQNIAAPSPSGSPTATIRAEVGTRSLGAADPLASLEARAREVMGEYIFISGSVTASSYLDYVEKIFGPTVYYYGKQITKAALVDEQRKFVNLWPERTYRIIPSTVQIDCDRSQASCLVSFDVAYKRLNRTKAKKTEEGIWHSTFRFVFSGQDPKIVEENGHTVQIK